MINNVIAIASSNGFIVLIIVLSFALLPQIASYSTQMISFGLIDAPYVSMAYCLEPVIATLIGFIVWNEQLDFIQIIGIFLAIGSIFYAFYAETTKLKEQHNVNE